MKVINYIVTITLLLCSNLLFGQTLVFNEIMSSNIESAPDEDGDYPDWVEIFNTGNVPLSLDGYGLSDDPDLLNKWIFPPVILDARSHLLIFASGKDRRAWASHNETVINHGDEWKYHIGTSESPTEWRELGFDDSGWLSGRSGFGFGDSDDSTIVEMGITSLYIRKSFNVEELDSVVYALLHVDYDDAFVAYLNGHEIARSNIGTPDSIPAFDDVAIMNHEALIYQGLSPELYVVNNFRDVLVEGTNLLAIQVHNADPGSSDLSLIPFFTLGMNHRPAGANGLADILKESLVPLHTNFKIKSDGERIFLSDSTGNEIDDVNVNSMPVDISYGRYPDGRSNWYYFDSPSPRAENSPLGKLNVSDLPELHPTAGLFSTPFEVAIIPPSPNSTIYYTVNGASPTILSDVYSLPIPVNSSTVIRAMVVEPQSVPSSIQTNSYIFYDTDLPIISLSTDPVNLFSAETGIYVLGNDYDTIPPHYGANYWQDWERPVHVEFFEPDGWLGFSVDAGVKIHGGWTRFFPQKSLALYLRSRYGTSTGIEYQIFPDVDIDKFESIILRTSGSDWDHTMFRDALLTGLVKDYDIDVQAYRPAVVFINGEYWGIHNIREKTNEHYIASHHNVNPDSVDIYNLWGGVLHGYWNAYDELFGFLNNNTLVDSANYAYVSSLINVDNYLTYNVTDIYVENSDWPGNNYKFYKPRYPDGKWRWFLYDTDFGFGLHGDTAYAVNTLEIATDPNGVGWPNPPESTFLLRKMLENDQFERDFINRFADMMNVNFDTTRVMKFIDSLRAGIESEIPYHLARWGRNIDEWNEKVAELPYFARRRPEHMRQHLIDKFNLSGTSSFNISIFPPDAGIVQINSIVPTDYPWEGTYFQRNSICVSAYPKPGFKFAYYGGDLLSYSQMMDAYVLTDMDVVAVFEAFPDSGKPVVINEINYNSDRRFDTEDWVELYAQYGDHDLSRFILRDGNDNNQFIFPEGTTLLQGQYLIVVRDSTDFDSLFPNVENVIGDMDFNFSNNGEQIRLYDARGGLYDSIAFNDSNSWPQGTDGGGHTLELIDPMLSGDSSAHWRASPLPHGSPGRDHDYHSPPNFALNMPINNSVIEGENARLRWFSSVDSDSGDSVHYRVEWSNNDDFLPMLQQTTSDTTLLINEIALDSLRTISGFSSGQVVFWRVFAIDGMGIETRSDSSKNGWSFTTELPTAFNVYPAYPNPFNSSFMITFALPQSDEVVIELFNILGQEIYHSAKTYSVGSHRLLFPDGELASALASGVYILRISSDDKINDQKVVMLK